VSNPYTRFLSTPVPQSEQEDPRQVANSAGGFSFVIDDKARLERFLILGTDGGTYYINERDLTKQNVDFLVDLIKRNGELVLETAHDISVEGRAYRNSAAIFVMALLFRYASDEVKSKAKALFPKIVRTSTHLFEFAKYIELMGGWGRAKRSVVASWYLSKTPDKLAYQAVKYRQRDGWTHRDLFRLSHPKGVNQELGNFILGKEVGPGGFPGIICGFANAQASENVYDLIQILNDYPNLPWEALPTQFHKEPDVWRKLFYNGQITGQALVRNITRLARIAAFDDMVFTADYASKLVDEEMIARTRLHPTNYLNALVVHEEGQIARNRSTWCSGSRERSWTTVPAIRDALNEGFHLAFKHVEPANKRTLLALDVSGSMSYPAIGIDLSADQVGAAMAMTVARTEPYYTVMGFSTEFKDLGISPGQSLSQVLQKTTNMNFGGTDCSLPMVWAHRKRIEVDTFLVITDNETWAGSIHPHVALRNYRQAMGIDARLVVAGVASNGFTIADPTDAGMLDVVGFDSNVPKVIADFSAGRF